MNLLQKVESLMHKSPGYFARGAAIAAVVALPRLLPGTDIGSALAEDTTIPPANSTSSNYQPGDKEMVDSLQRIFAEFRLPDGYTISSSAPDEKLSHIFSHFKIESDKGVSIFSLPGITRGYVITPHPLFIPDHTNIIGSDLDSLINNVVSGTENSSWSSFTRQTQTSNNSLLVLGYNDVHIELLDAGADGRLDTFSSTRNYRQEIASNRISLHNLVLDQDGIHEANARNDKGPLLNLMAWADAQQKYINYIGGWNGITQDPKLPRLSGVYIDINYKSDSENASKKDVGIHWVFGYGITASKTVSFNQDYGPNGQSALGIYLSDGDRNYSNTIYFIKGGKVRQFAFYSGNLTTGLQSNYIDKPLSNPAVQEFFQKQYEGIINSMGLSGALPKPPLLDAKP